MTILVMTLLIIIMIMTLFIITAIPLRRGRRGLLTKCDRDLACELGVF